MRPPRPAAWQGGAMDDVVIRASRPTDMAAVADLRWRWSVDEDGVAPAVTPAEYRDAMRVFAAEHPDSHRCVVAERDGRVLAMAWLALNPRPPAPHRPRGRVAAELQTVYVHPTSGVPASPGGSSSGCSRSRTRPEPNASWCTRASSASDSTGGSASATLDGCCSGRPRTDTAQPEPGRPGSGRPGSERSGPRRELLQRPGVAVGVAEEDEAAPGELVDPDRVDAEVLQVGEGLVGVRTTTWTDFSDPGGTSGDMIPSPNAIEQAEPGGVACTNRTSSETRWSWSMTNPMRS